MPFRTPNTLSVRFCASAFEDSVQTSKKNKKSKIVHERIEDIKLPAAEMYDINHMIETKNMDKQQVSQVEPYAGLTHSRQSRMNQESLI